MPETYNAVFGIPSKASFIKKENWKVNIRKIITKCHGTQRRRRLSACRRVLVFEEAAHQAKGKGCRASAHVHMDTEAWVQGALCNLRCLEWAVEGGGEKGQKVHLSERLWLLIIVIISYYSCPWSPLFKMAYKEKKEAKQADHWLLPLSPTVFKPLQAQKEGMWCWDVSLCKHAMSSMDEDGIYLRRWLNEHPSVSQKKMMQDHKYGHKAGMPGLEISCHSHLSFTPFGGKEGMVATVVCLFVFTTNLFSKLLVRDLARPSRAAMVRWGAVVDTAGCWAR